MRGVREDDKIDLSLQPIGYRQMIDPAEAAVLKALHLHDGFQTGTLISCFADLAAPEKKIHALEKSGELIRLKRGLYVVNELVSGKTIDSRLCANHLYGPSYVSLLWALRFYGLIPERVFQMTSVTAKRTRGFDTLCA